MTTNILKYLELLAAWAEDKGDEVIGEALDRMWYSVLTEEEKVTLRDFVREQKEKDK